MGKSVAIRLVIAFVMVGAISYFSNASYYLALIIVVVLSIFGEIIHMPENLPGASDNPDGKEVHPAKAMFLGILVVVALVGIGEAMPELYEYAPSHNS